MVISIESIRKDRIVGEFDRLLSALAMGSRVVGGHIYESIGDMELKAFSLMIEAKSLGIDLAKELNLLH